MLPNLIDEATVSLFSPTFWRFSEEMLYLPRSFLVSTLVNTYQNSKEALSTGPASGFYRT